MAVSKRHYVTFLSPGTLFSESTTRPIDSWDTPTACRLVEGIVERHGARPYGFYFETVKTADPVDDGEGGQLQVQPKTIRKSGVHFLGGELLTYGEVVARNDPKESILRSNMSGQDRCICCINTNSYRTTMPFSEDDQVVDPQSGAVLERGDDPVHVRYRAARKKARDEEFEREWGKRSDKEVDSASQ